jgi:ribosomal protein S18 acetylase RimI-like enzyme
MIHRLEPPVPPEDLGALADLLLDGIASNASLGFGADTTFDQAREWWAGLKAGASVLLVAREDGRIVGSSVLGFSPFPNGHHRAELGKLIVLSTYRRRGIARELMRESEAEARRAGKTLLFLNTETGGAPEGLYRALGWTAAGIIPDFAYRPDGELRPTTFYYKRLSF